MCEHIVHAIRRVSTHKATSALHSLAATRPWEVASLHVRSHLTLSTPSPCLCHTDSCGMTNRVRRRCSESWQWLRWRCMPCSACCGGALVTFPLEVSSAWIGAPQVLLNNAHMVIAACVCVCVGSAEEAVDVLGDVGPDPVLRLLQLQVRIAFSVFMGAQSAAATSGRLTPCCWCNPPDCCARAAPGYGRQHVGDCSSGSVSPCVHGCCSVRAQPVEGSWCWCAWRPYT